MNSAAVSINHSDLLAGNQKFALDSMREPCIPIHRNMVVASRHTVPMTTAIRNVYITNMVRINGMHDSEPHPRTRPVPMARFQTGAAHEPNNSWPPASNGGRKYTPRMSRNVARTYRFRKPVRTCCHSMLNETSAIPVSAFSSNQDENLLFFAVDQTGHNRLGYPCSS